MGFISDITGGVGDTIGGIFDMAGGKKKRADAGRAKQYYEEDREAFWEGYGKLNREPVYQSQLIGPYQSTQSPLARQYLESMLTGDNRDAAATPWADPNAADAIRRQSNERYGTLDEIMQDERNQKAKPPAWATKTPAEPGTRNRL